MIRLRLFRRLTETFRLMVGVPDYETYCAHQACHHPDEQVMSRAEFLRERQRQRYDPADGTISRCC